MVGMTYAAELLLDIQDARHMHWTTALTGNDGAQRRTQVPIPWPIYLKTVLVPHFQAPGTKTTVNDLLEIPALSDFHCVYLFRGRLTIVQTPLSQPIAAPLKTIPPRRAKTCHRNSLNPPLLLPS